MDPPQRKKTLNSTQTKECLLDSAKCRFHSKEYYIWSNCDREKRASEVADPACPFVGTHCIYELSPQAPSARGSSARLPLGWPSGGTPGMLACDGRMRAKNMYTIHNVKRPYIHYIVCKTSLHTLTTPVQ